MKERRQKERRQKTQFRALFLITVNGKTWAVNGKLLGICNGVQCVTVSIDLSEQVKAIGEEKKRDDT